MSEQLNASRVLILLSMYNGERYISEQLDSLLNQTVPVDIVIRDDGSTDNSVKIVESYLSKNDNIRLIKGQNIGFVKSFNRLILDCSVDDRQWIAFCDQDDVWLPRKLEVAIDALKKVDNQNIPLMYCSNLCLVDEFLKPIGYMRPHSTKVLNSCIYVQNIATGCTMVFNKIALAKYRQGIDVSMIAHDYMMHCICKFFGRVLYDHESYILYRQHGNNTIGSDHMTYKLGALNILNDLMHPKPELRVKFFGEFINAYESELSDDTKKNLLRFVNYKKIRNRFYEVLNSSAIGYEFKATVAFKLRALVGRMY